ncbi:hypothetical protein MUP77_19590 [Candidatus Bathyarchaeota archaeon]|nr:hypothetical protein [Candidatus Bathyarchaeota archaeon]
MFLQTPLEKTQADRIQFLENRVGLLEKENFVLRAALTHQTIEAERTYRDNIGKFDQLSRQVWETVAHLNKIWIRATTYDEIVKAFQREYPNVAKGETICRRVREMVEQGWMETPIRGSFIVVKKPNP